MLSILKFSGKQWSRAALAWVVFAVAVDGLAKAGAEEADAKIAAYTAAVALGILNAPQQNAGRGQYQVAKVAVSELNLEAIEPAGFGDTDETR